MKRAHFSQALPLVLLVSAAVWAAPAADHSGGAAPATASGAYAVTFHVNTPPTARNGAAVTCKLRIVPGLSAFENHSAQAVPVESSTGVAQVAGSAADCTVLLPFAYAVASPAGFGQLSYAIAVQTDAGSIFIRSRQPVAVAYPQPGSTTTLRLNVPFQPGNW